MDRTVRITLDKERHLKYTWGALRWLKDEHGLTVGSLDRMTDDWTLLVPWLVAGLRDEDKDITAELVEANLDVDVDVFNEVVLKVLDAMRLAERSDVPESKEENPTPTQAGDNSIGSGLAA